MPIMFFNILTAISLDAIPEMMKNASDNIILNKIEYFEAIEFYIVQEYTPKTEKGKPESRNFKKKLIEMVNKNGRKISLTLYKIYDFVIEIINK